MSVVLSSWKRGTNANVVHAAPRKKVSTWAHVVKVAEVNYVGGSLLHSVILRLILQRSGVFEPVLPLCLYLHNRTQWRLFVLPFAHSPSEPIFGLCVCICITVHSEGCLCCHLPIPHMTSLVFVTDLCTSAVTQEATRGKVEKSTWVSCEPSENSWTDLHLLWSPSILCIGKSQPVCLVNLCLSTLQIWFCALTIWVVIFCIIWFVLRLSGNVSIFGCPCPNFPVVVAAHELIECCWCAIILTLWELSSNW
jgi:hypothetical protein